MMNGLPNDLSLGDVFVEADSNASPGSAGAAAEGHGNDLDCQQTQLGIVPDRRLAAVRVFPQVTDWVHAWCEAQEADRGLADARSEHAQTVYAKETSTFDIMSNKFMLKLARAMWDARKASGAPGKHAAKPPEVLHAEERLFESYKRAAFHILLAVNARPEMCDQLLAQLSLICQWVPFETGVVIIITGRGSHSPSGVAGWAEENLVAAEQQES
ncbi:hypothetical protein JKP88DRAFT_282133 [Tribonema minus]|uniref:Smr domain-containing protein n=1 Tax=Tribonema minus TaxID=303371 RepID=A0A836C9U5_9STRA|nr:hypothetical protein JKP88DRAFT_282133 [Tribonema minus]